MREKEIFRSAQPRTEKKLKYYPKFFSIKSLSNGEIIINSIKVFLLIRKNL